MAGEKPESLTIKSTAHEIIIDGLIGQL